MQRGMEAPIIPERGSRNRDDVDLEWPKQVLANVQNFALSSGFYVQRMMSRIAFVIILTMRRTSVVQLVFRPFRDQSVGRAADCDPARLEHFSA